MAYLFEKTESKELNKIIKTFDKQIKEEYKSAKGNKYKCASYWKKTIFNESKDFSISDWLEVRKGGYWEKRDSLVSFINLSNCKTEKEDAKINLYKFILSKIKKYKV